MTEQAHHTDPAVAESDRDRTPTALVKVTSEQLEALRRRTNAWRKS